MQFADALSLRLGSRRGFGLALLLLDGGEGVEIGRNLGAVGPVSGGVDLDRAAERGRRRGQVAQLGLDLSTAVRKRVSRPSSVDDPGSGNSVPCHAESWQASEGSSRAEPS